MADPYSHDVRDQRSRSLYSVPEQDLEDVREYRSGSLRSEGSGSEQGAWSTPPHSTGTPTRTRRADSMPTQHTNNDQDDLVLLFHHDHHAPTEETTLSSDLSIELETKRNENENEDEDEDIFYETMTAPSPLPQRMRRHRASDYGQSSNRDDTFAEMTSSPVPQRLRQHRASDFGQTSSSHDSASMRLARRTSQQASSLSLGTTDEEVIQSMRSPRSERRDSDAMLVQFYVEMSRQGKIRNIPKEVAGIIIRDEQERVQKKTFTNWINSYLKQYEPPTKMEDLFEDIKDGLKLICLLEVLSAEKIPKKKKVPTATLR